MSNDPSTPALTQLAEDEVLLRDSVAEFAEAQPLPPQIVLFLENILDYAEGDPAAFRDEVRLTYLHELGHYLGWDENEIAQRGLD